MKLYRYELYYNNEPQKVGFIVGLGNCDFADEYVDSLLEPFDEMLPFPPDKRRKDSVCAFTEFGKMVFHDTIEQIIHVYEDTVFEVRELVTEIDDSELGKLSYQDEYQACIPINLLNRIKWDVNDAMKVRFAA